MGLGILPFIIGIFYEILGESGIVPYIPLGEIGFLGIAIAASLQMANSVIQTEEALEGHQHNLEALVEERTEELEAAQERMLSQAQKHAAEIERNRLARDLHDAVTQTIYSASLITQVLPQIWDRNPEEGKRNLAKLRQLVRGALAELRIMLFELRPNELETASLDTLIIQLGDTFTGHSQIPVSIDYEGEQMPPPEIKIAAYRIAQEAFNNIIKHADSTQVNVILQASPNRISQRIQDNGIGFDLQLVKTEGMGLKIMSERAQEIEGQLEIDSSPGKGTSVNFEWIQLEK